MIVFFDFETTGLPDFNKRARDPDQPHIVQLAAIMTDDAGKVMESHNVIIKPDGWKIPKEVSDIHGITEEIAAIGIPEKRAALLLFDMVKKCDLMVAHNIQFDKFLARIALRRFDIFTDAEDAWWKLFPTFCTMRETTELCRLPGKRPGQFKWPKLTEAYRHIFQTEIDNAHDALADVTACMEIYFWLKKTSNVIVVPDGDGWIAHRPGFENLQESDAGSSNDSAIAAINHLLEVEGNL